MKHFGLDTETHDPLLLDLGPSWVFSQGEVIVTGLYDAQKAEKKALVGAGGVTVLKLLSSATTTIVGANLNYDLGWLCHAHGMAVTDIKCKLIDVQIAESFIDEYAPYTLDDLALKYLHERKGAEKLQAIALQKGLKGDFRKHLKALWDEGYKQEIKDYVTSDADQPCRIWEKQKAILEEQGLMQAFELNMTVAKITLGMKQRGVRIDYDKWQENCAIAEKAHTELLADFTAKYGVVNVRSSKQMAVLLDREQVPYKHKIVFKGWAPEGLNEKGKPKKFNKNDWFAGDDVWDQRKRLKESFPNIRVSKGKLVLMVQKQYAERTAAQASKMGYEVTCNPSINKFLFTATKATYKVIADTVELKIATDIVTKFLGLNFGRFLVKDKNGDWRLHGNINVIGARTTGRMSSSQVNLQNIPSKTVLFAGTDREVNLAHMCREVFLPERGHLALKLDFSGQENRLQAHFAVGESGKVIRRMYNENPRLDEHQFVADRSGLEEEHGKKIGRKLAKNVRFGLGYGMQIITMCEQFGWGHDFAEGLIEAVKNASPWMVDTMNYLQDMLLGKGRFQGRARPWIKTLIGRRVHLRPDRHRDAYKFYNYLIQGSAADMLKLCLVLMLEKKIIDAEVVVAILLLLVHDEGVFSIPMDELCAQVVVALQWCMEHGATLTVPVICDPEIGPNWADCEGQKKDETTGEFTETVEELVLRVISEIKTGKKIKVQVEEDKVKLFSDEELEEIEAIQDGDDIDDSEEDVF